MDYSISFYRKLRKMSQQELADKLEITRTELSFIETRKVLPKIDIAQKVAGILEVTIGQIFIKEDLDYMLFRSN